MRNKILGVLAIIIFGVLVYAQFSSPGSKKSESQNPPQGGGETPETKEEKKSEPRFKLLYRQNLTSEKSTHPGNQVVQLEIYDLSDGGKKLVFTDLDEDFQIRLVSGLSKDSVLVFGTPLNETTGSIWQIKLDGTGSKKQIITQFSASAFSSNGEKIAFITYDNVQGVYQLWLCNLDGRFKTKILESETALSDPIFLDKTLAFVKIDKEGNGTINTVNLDGTGLSELVKAKGELIYSLSFGSNKFVYVKIPKAGGENSSDIYVYDLNTKSEKRITNDKIADNFPVLSKDGTKLAFYKNGKIWVGNSDGTDLKTIVAGNQPIGFLE